MGVHVSVVNITIGRAKRIVELNTVATLSHNTSTSIAIRMPCVPYNADDKHRFLKSLRLTEFDFLMDMISFENSLCSDRQLLFDRLIRVAFNSEARFM